MNRLRRAFSQLFFTRRGSSRTEKLTGVYTEEELAHSRYLIEAYNKGDWDGAIALLSELVETQPDGEKWCRYLLTAYEKKGNQQETIAGVKRLIARYPTNQILCQYLEQHLIPEQHGTFGNRSETDVPSQADAIQDLASRFLAEAREQKKPTELETKKELEERLERSKAEELKPKALTPWEKFKRIKPTGLRDGY
jgi:hypothetical protein